MVVCKHNNKTTTLFIAGKNNHSYYVIVVASFLFVDKTQLTGKNNHKKRMRIQKNVTM